MKKTPSMICVVDEIKILNYIILQNMFKNSSNLLKKDNDYRIYLRGCETGIFCCLCPISRPG